MARNPIKSEIKQDLNTRFSRRNSILDRLLEIIIDQEGTSFDKKTKTKINPYDAIVGYGRLLKPGDKDPVRGTPTANKPISKMTFAEVKEFGRALVNASKGNVGQGSTKGSSAVGAFQLLANYYNTNNPIVQNLQERLGYKDSDIFDEEAQKNLAKALIEEIAGDELSAYLEDPSKRNATSLISRIGKNGNPDTKETDGWDGVSRVNSIGKSTKNRKKLPFGEKAFENLTPQESIDKQMSEIMKEEDAPGSIKRLSLKEKREAAETSDDPLSDAMGPRLITQQRSGIDLTRDDKTSPRDIDNYIDPTVEPPIGSDLPENAASDAFYSTNLPEFPESDDIQPARDMTDAEMDQRDMDFAQSLNFVRARSGGPGSSQDPEAIAFRTRSGGPGFSNVYDMSEEDRQKLQDENLQESLRNSSQVLAQMDANIDRINREEAANLLSAEAYQPSSFAEPNSLVSFFEGMFLDEPSPYPEGEVEDTEQYGDEFYNEPDQSWETQDSEPVFENEPMPMGGEADIRDESEDVIMNFNEGGEVKADFDGKNKEEEDATDPPPLAKPKEVADDIPALLSEGEYVLPANVVRYIGLERIIDMHRQVLSEIQQMTDLGMIQNVDKNGEPEDDNGEMKFAKEKKPEEGMTKGTIIVASSKPKGIMCDPLKFGDGGAGEADTKDEDETFVTDWTPEVEFDFGDEGPEDDPTRLDYMADPDFQKYVEVDETTETFGDDESGRELFKEELKKVTDAEKENNKKQFSYTDKLSDLVENQESGVGQILGKVVQTGFARTFGILEGLDEFMNQKKAESWANVKEAKIKEIEARERRPYDEAKDGAEVRVAQRAAFASQSGDPLEQMFAAGSTSVENPVGNFSDKEWAEAAKQYSDYFNEGGQGGNNFIESTKDFIQSLINPKKEKSSRTSREEAANLLSAEAYQPSSKSLIVPFENLRPKFPKADDELGDDALGFPRPEATPAGLGFTKEGLDEYYKDKFATGGGLMVKKKFNSGGTYIPGVGYRETVAPKLGSESDFFGTNRTYDDIISGIYGDGRGFLPQLEDNPDKRKRSILSKQLPMNDWRSRGRSKRDPYLRLDLREYETDPEYQEDIMRDFAKGRSKLGNLGDRQSAKLSKELTNYAIAKRQQYQGFLEGDMANLPEGSTNRDALKTIFWKELSWDRTNTSQDAMDDPQPYGEYTAGFGPGVAFYGKPRRPMEAKNFKKMWLTPFSEEQKQGLDNSKLGKLLDLDGPADIEKINRAQSFLTSQGNDRFINPDTAVPAGYIDNIFNEYLGFKGSPLRSGEKSDSMSKALMGKTYVEGVGYR